MNIWEPTDLNRADQTWATLGMMIAKRNIAQKWGAVQAPVLGDWCRDMDMTMAAEKAAYVQRMP